MDEKRIQIAAKLYQARDTVRRLFDTRYLTKVEQFKDFVRAEMARKKCNELTAAMKIVADLQRDCPDSGMTQAMILAACVECTVVEGALATDQPARVAGEEAGADE